MTILKTPALLLFAFLPALTSMSCSNEQTTTQEVKTDSIADKEFFPVYDLIQTEIRSVDSLPVGLKYYVTTNGKTDSGYITVPDFDKLASMFTPETLKPAALKQNFKETSFYDRSTKSSTFMYQPVNNKSTLRRVDVITKASDTYDKVSSIYIENFVPGKDSSVLNKMIWTAGRFMQINQQVTLPGKPPIERQTKVIWNNWDETP